MENTSDTLRTLFFLRGREKSRALLLATVAEAAQLWREVGSLAAYHVLVWALDSSDDEVRKLAEEALNRTSPRPASHQANSGGATSRKSEPWQESA